MKQIGSMSHSVRFDTLHVMIRLFLLMGTAPSLASHPNPVCGTEVLQLAETEPPNSTITLSGLS